MLYFAYGSNMDPQQMKSRCPDVAFVGIGVLADHALCFPRRSIKWNCGVSSLAPRTNHDAWGVVYRLTATDLAALDASEGFRIDRPSSLNSYNRVSVVVRLDDVSTEMVTYIAVGQQNPPLPNVEYLTRIRDGARHHVLPAAYLDYLDGIEHG